MRRVFDDVPTEFCFSNQHHRFILNIDHIRYVYVGHQSIEMQEHVMLLNWCYQENKEE